MTLLTVDQLGVTFLSEEDRLRAVDDVSFQLAAGERLGVVGESGSGKTALHLALLGLLPPGRAEVTGAAHLGDIDLLACTPRQWQGIRGKRMAMVFQNPLSAFNPFLTIGDQIAEPLTFHLRLSRRQARARGIALLERVGIREASRRVDDYPHQFSGGMRQRAMIAMALAGEPELIIADEPTTALDATVRRQILELFAEVCRESGAALILITHDLKAAAAICQRIHVMYAGHIVETAATSELLSPRSGAGPRHPYTQALLQASLGGNVPPGEMLPMIAGRPPDLRRIPAGCAFHPRCGHREDRCEAERPLLRSLESGENATARTFACHVDITASAVR